MCSNSWNSWNDFPAEWWLKITPAFWRCPKMPQIDQSKTDPGFGIPPKLLNLTMGIARRVLASLMLDLGRCHASAQTTRYLPVENT